MVDRITEECFQREIIFKEKVRWNIAEQMWERPIQDYLNYRALTYEVFSFGNTDIMADEWVQLVKAEKKTATSSVFCFYEMEGAALPQGGELSIVLNSKKHAYKEGEGNQS